MNAETIEKLKARMVKRFRFLYDDIKEALEKSGLQNRTEIDRYILGLAIVDYFEDIERLKSFEGIKRINEAKIYAYTIYWLSRRKPIQVIKPEPQDKRLQSINEIIFSMMLLARMYSEAGENIEESNNERNDFFKLLYYNLKYRTYTQKTLELMIEAFFLGCKTK